MSTIISKALKNYRSKRALLRFRRALTPSQEVVVDTGKRTFQAIVYLVMDDHVVIYNNDLQFGAYGKNCIFPKEEKL